MDCIRKYYGVKAKRGGRVLYKETFFGTILGASDGRLRIRLDGETRVGRYHPKWELEYL
jgi:hypothetical protein